MALKDSTMLPLGTPLPHFELPDAVTGRRVSPEDFVGKAAMLVMFICRHCPYVVHVQEELAKLGRDYQRKNLGIVAHIHREFFVKQNDIYIFGEDIASSQLQQFLAQGFPILSLVFIASA